MNIVKPHMTDSALDIYARKVNEATDILAAALGYPDKGTGQHKFRTAKLGDWLFIAAVNEAAEAINGVRKLHWDDPLCPGYCNGCDLPWPCPTDRALSGGDADGQG